MKCHGIWNNRYLDILSPTIFKITGKKIRVGKKSFIQTHTHMYGSNWMELNHELSHWLVATQDERKLPNLGFPDSSCKTTITNYKQEILASKLNYELNSLFNMNDEEYNYSVYVADTILRIPPLIGDEEHLKIWNDNKTRIMSLPEVKETIKLIKSLKDGTH